MKNMTDRIPQTLVLKDSDEGFDIYTQMNEHACLTHLATLVDRKQAERTAENIARAMGARFVNKLAVAS